jgi:hypothetical protein
MAAAKITIANLQADVADQADFSLRIKVPSSSILTTSITPSAALRGWIPLDQYRRAFEQGAVVRERAAEGGAQEARAAGDVSPPVAGQKYWNSKRYLT